MSESTLSKPNLPSKVTSSGQSHLPHLYHPTYPSADPHQITVKNRFSNPTKEQEGQDWQGKDVMNDHKGKALREGCCEREWAQMSVSSRERNNTKRNLVRATTKSKSEMQTVSNGCVGQWVKNRGV